MIPYIKLIKLKNLISNDIFYFTIAAYILVLIIHALGFDKGYNKCLRRCVKYMDLICDERIKDALNMSPV